MADVRWHACAPWDPVYQQPQLTLVTFDLQLQLQLLRVNKTQLLLPTCASRRLLFPLRVLCGKRHPLSLLQLASPLTLALSHASADQTRLPIGRMRERSTRCEARLPQINK